MASQCSTGAGTRKHAPRSRRTTCDICRERKVRCDKDQPACERCRRLSLKCTYSPVTLSLSDPDVTRTLSHLHERLAQAEGIISAMTPAPTWSSTSQQTHYTPEPSGLEAPESPSSSLLLGLNDPSFGCFPNSNDAYLSQDFVGSWDVNIENPNDTPVIPVSMPQFSSSSSSVGESLRMSFLPTAQPQPMSNLQTPNKVATISIPPFNLKFPCLCSIENRYSNQLSIEEGSNGENVVSLLHQRYFKSNQWVPFSPSPERFFQLLAKHPVRHQVNALSYAIAISGATLGDDFPNLKSLFYRYARQHLELSEQQEEGACFLNLETLQTLLLILRHELGEGNCIGRAWVTHGRVMTVVKLLHMDAIDSGQDPGGSHSLYVPQLPPASPTEVDERRQTFWMAFTFDFFTAALSSSLPILQTIEILTYLPIAEETETEDPSSGRFLEDAIAQPSNHRFSNYTPIIIATALGNKVLRHVKLSRVESSSLVYDFWTQHFKLDKIVLLHLAHSPHPRQATMLRYYVRLLITHLTLLGVSILIHMTAFEQANKACFADTLALWSRQRFEKLAMQIGEFFHEGGELSHLKSSLRNQFNIYLTWPVCLAAKAQILSIKNPTTTIDHSSMSTASEVSSIALLRFLESVIKSFQVDTPYSNDILQEISSVLENKGKSS